MPSCDRERGFLSSSSSFVWLAKKNNMNAQDIKNIIQKELGKETKFLNWHGISLLNIEQYLVEPFEILIDPDDLETEARNMWVVLTLRKSYEEGYVIVYDPLVKSWGVASHVKDGNFILDVAGESFYDALDSM